VIGERLPMEFIRIGIDQIVLSRDGGHELTKAIMTTDTVPKETAVAVKIGDGRFIIGGVAKGAGMIHPALATLLCFLTTDATVDIDFLKLALQKAVDVSFNMISIDGDTSPNDMVLMLANGLAGNKPVSQDSQQADAFQQALDQVCLYLAKCIARDGEGASKLIEVTVNGAPSLAEARLAARTVVSSSLVKSAVHGNDPNWGRLMVTLGSSGLALTPEKIDIFYDDIQVVRKGASTGEASYQKARKAVGKEFFTLTVNLHQGKGKQSILTSDLSHDYVTLNASYRS